MNRNSFFTEVPIPQIAPEFQINYQSNIVSIGSCFSDTISEKLSFLKFNILANPFGIIFHPLAIENLLKRSLTNDFFSKDSIFYHNELWHSFEVHSQCSKLTSNELLHFLNTNLIELKNSITTATHLFITLGTAWVYRHLETQKIVTNCHKIPQQFFKKELLNFNQILESLQNIEILLKTYNSKIKIIFTISPVRHLKDGFIENNLSKSLLITTLHSFLKNKNEQNFYFPSYEIMLDELRDYRFYADDMLHPSQRAIAHIWEKFKACFIDKNCWDTIKKVEEIQRNLQHKPFYANTESYKKFTLQTQKKITELQQKHPNIFF